jgi:dTDP-4-dehydrorhamnose 3,5-epimerase
MKITEIKKLSIPEVVVIGYKRFLDHRGYFTETFRKSDLIENSGIESLKGKEFLQANESFSHKGTFRGLHFQWNPYMGKLVRPVKGDLIDFALDIRKGSPTLGKIIGYRMQPNIDREYGEWIWLPSGFAHGILLLEDSLIEYFCTGEYSPGCEAGISPLADDIDWSLCDSELKKQFDEIVPDTAFISDKDRNGLTLKEWLKEPRSDNFKCHGDV